MACDSASRAIENEVDNILRTIYFNLNYVEAALRAENKTDPIAYTINSGIKTRLSFYNQKNINIYFKQIEVNTDLGFFVEQFKTESSMIFDSVNTDISDRQVNQLQQEVNSDGTTSNKPSAFLEFNIFSSNKKIIYTRKYSKLIEVFSDVGGIVEVVSFITLILYAWYNSLRME